jgi:glycine dehydrogenase
VVATGGSDGITAVSSAPYGSALLLPITYAYIKMLGERGLRLATEMAIVNANYMARAISPEFRTFYSGENGRVGHEMILDLQNFKRDYGVEVGDVARRLMDYGFHAPTLSFPVHDTFMVEPTESEGKAEMDRFVAAMIAIKRECEAATAAADSATQNAASAGKAVESSTQSGGAVKAEGGNARFGNRQDNPVVNAPHTAAEIAGVTGEWSHPYSREVAAFPAEWVRASKYFPVVSKIDAGYGDRNLVCTWNS